MTKIDYKNQLFMHFKCPLTKKVEPPLAKEVEPDANYTNPLSMHFKNPINNEVEPKAKSEQQSFEDMNKQEAKTDGSD